MYVALFAKKFLIRLNIEDQFFQFWWKMYVGENPVCWRKTFTDMQLLERRDVGEKYIGEILCLWICMKLYVSNFINGFTYIIHKLWNFCLHKHTPSPTFRNSSPTYFTNINSAWRSSRPKNINFSLCKKISMRIQVFQIRLWLVCDNNLANNERTGDMPLWTEILKAITIWICSNMVHNLWSFFWRIIRFFFPRPMLQ